MTRKLAPKMDDPEQSKRFIEAAKEVGADEDMEALGRAFKKIASSKSAAESRRHNVKSRD
jgi:hypothetical protein